MKNIFKVIVITAVATLGLLTPVLFTDNVAAVNPIADACTQSGSGSALCTDPNGNTVASVSGTIINVLLFIVGLVSVVMIIVGGLRMATSGSDTGAVTSAKNTIFYAVIGLVVAFVAFAIVNWVIDIL
jgi:hypothetical protein